MSDGLQAPVQHAHSTNQPSDNESRERQREARGWRRYETHFSTLSVGANRGSDAAQPIGSSPRVRRTNSTCYSPPQHSTVRNNTRREPKWIVSLNAAEKREMNYFGRKQSLASHLFGMCGCVGREERPTWLPTRHHAHQRHGRLPPAIR